MNKKLRGNLLLLLTALIWGTSFVAQRAGMDYIEPFTFNGIRSLIGGIVLIPVIFFLGKMNPADDKEESTEEEKKSKNRRSSWAEFPAESFSSSPVPSSSSESCTPLPEKLDLSQRFILSSYPY